MLQKNISQRQLSVLNLDLGNITPRANLEVEWDYCLYLLTNQGMLVFPSCDVFIPGKMKQMGFCLNRK